MLPRWVFPATRLTRELRKASYRVDVDRYIPFRDSDIFGTETLYTVYNKNGLKVACYITDLPWEGLRIKTCKNADAGRIMEKFAELPSGLPTCGVYVP